MTDWTYAGNELGLLSHAVNWKRYWVSEIRSYAIGDVLEVGAGIGANTSLLKSDCASSWTCLEPDPDLAGQMRKRFARDPSLADCQIRTTSTAELGRDSKFDTIFYIDVLEHISDDREELERAARLLRENGRIIVLAPAHQFLYTAFDKAIGHFRRYDKPSLTACSPTNCELVRLIYLDSVGILASLSNRLVLRQPMPTLTQIIFWGQTFSSSVTVFGSPSLSIRSANQSLLSGRSAPAIEMDGKPVNMGTSEDTFLNLSATPWACNSNFLRAAWPKAKGRAFECCRL
jgi:SAM-dependent methyltransferase